MSNPSLVIIYRDDERESTKSIHSFYPPRSPIHRLPFATNFATGVGKKFFVEGSVRISLKAISLFVNSTVEYRK